MKVFDLYDTSDIVVEDPGLKRYILVEPRITVKSRGKNREKFGKGKIHIVERLINALAVPSHRGKKHKIITRVAGKYYQQTKIVLGTFKLIEEKTKENPIQVFVKAIENAAPRDEITTIEYGGARYPQAVDTSPIRRINLAIKNIVHGAQDKSFNKKTKLIEALANEIIAASKNSNESFAVTKKIEIEKQADSAR